MLFLSFDEMPGEERPPRRIWLDGERLNEWFERIKRNREREVSSRQIDDPVENELTKEMLDG